tara:strand:- start:11903 stop:12055 length:153 start_codon:yes stop_codon:yes gene_type:complete
MSKKTGQRGQGDRGGWPSTTDNESGKGRSNNPSRGNQTSRESGSSKSGKK